MTETWLPVPGYAGLYEVSDLGNVRSLDRNIVSKDGMVKRLRGRVLKRIINLRGDRYPLVSLSMNGHAKPTKLHILVLETFEGPRPSAAHEACHGDGDRSNPALSNLRWGTQSENCGDRVLHGTQVWGEKAHGAKLTEEAVRVIRSSYRTSAYLARQYGVSRTAVAKVRRGLSWARS